VMLYAWFNKFDYIAKLQFYLNKVKTSDNVYLI